MRVVLWGRVGHGRTYRVGRVVPSPELRLQALIESLKEFKALNGRHRVWLPQRALPPGRG